MKHSYNDDSGIKMIPNKYGAMKWNDVLVEMNNLTYYMHETELRMQRYGMTNMARNNIIANPDQLQQPRPNWITYKQSARKHFEAKVEHENDILD